MDSNRRVTHRDTFHCNKPAGDLLADEQQKDSRFVGIYGIDFYSTQLFTAWSLKGIPQEVSPEQISKVPSLPGFHAGYNGVFSRVRVSAGML